MKLASSQVLKMHVYTTSGTHVGKVVDFSIDVDSGLVLEYLVRRGLVGSIAIDRDRVVRVEEDRLIVEDHVSADIEGATINLPLSSPDIVGLTEDRIS